MTKKHSGILNALILIIPPLAVMAILLINFYNNELFPFGKGTISWCDMSQQVIPLIADLKDMLTGKAGVFLNLHNAGGMNMWGVIFFFVASPLNFAALFVDKSNLIYFVNVLLIVKLMLSAFTAALYFRKCQKELSPVFAVILSCAYGLCGYGMLFYQNIIWLDMMYLFPLLIISFNYLTEKKKIFPYVITLTAMMTVNYYIGYMVVLYILLFMGLFVFRYRREEKYRDVSSRFIIGSALSAMLSAVVWLPSFAQYLSSGRSTSASQLVTSGFFGNYQTTVTQLFCTAFVFAVLLICVSDGKPRGKKLNTYLIMLLLLLIPMFIEPINIFWHTGSYMAFPGRYGFITLFIGIICVGMFLSDGKRLPAANRSKCANIIALIVCSVVTAAYCNFITSFISKNFDVITNYTKTLWQSNDSFLTLLEIFAVSSAVFFLLYAVYRKGFIKKEVFAMLLCIAVSFEIYGNINIYVSSPSKHNPYRAANYEKVMSLSDRINDTDFYRVKTSEKLFDVNLLGAMGYNSLSHYTSLTSKDYMFMAKQMGYSSYWMEVGSHGGTEISDAIFNIKYKIASNTLAENAVYSNGSYQILKQEQYLPLGIITSSDLSDCEKLDEKSSRQQIQELLYNKLISNNENAQVTQSYQPTNTEGVTAQTSKSPCEFKLSEKTGYLYYSIQVIGRQSLYFDCFDKLSNNLREEINDSFDVFVNGYILNGEYPSQKNNGLLYLGTFENTFVNIKICVKKDVKCNSFGVFGVNLNRLDSSLNNVKTAELTEKCGRITGVCQGSQGEKCVLSLPYQDSLCVKINGEKVSVKKVFGDMICFDLKPGENKIEISNTPKSFYIGLAVTLIGIILCIIYRLGSKKIRFGETLTAASNLLTVGLGALIILLIYIMPCIVKLLSSI